MTYEGSDDNKGVKLVLAYNENSTNNYNVVITSENDDEVKEALSEKEMENEIKVTCMQ